MKKTEVVAEQRARVDAHDSFDVENVTGAFDDYIRVHKPETTVLIALKAHTPEVKEDEIIIEIDNKLQQEKLEAIKVSLQNALMKKLNNGRIFLTFRFFDDTKGKEERRLITAQDKLQYFMEKNAAVAEMCRLFGLELD